MEDNPSVFVAIRCPGAQDLELRPIDIGTPNVLILESFLLRRDLQHLPSHRVHSHFGILELNRPSPNQVTVPPFHLQGLQAPLYKAGQEAQVLDTIVEPQVLYSQSPDSAWARPTSEVPDPTRGSW
jgi:hypothetical protein